VLQEHMEIFQTVGTAGGIIVGLVSLAAEILVAFWFLRTFKIIRRREYARLQRADADHQICRAESDRVSTLNDWAKEIRIASRELANKFKWSRSSTLPGPSGIADKIAQSAKQ